MGRLARITRLSSTELFRGNSACLNCPEVALADKAASFGGSPPLRAAVEEARSPMASH